LKKFLLKNYPQVDLSEEQIRKMMGMVDDLQIFKKELVIVLAKLTMKVTDKLFASILVLKDYLGALARVCTRQGQPVKWKTPNGFLIQQLYVEFVG
jgi:hypothetical protein